jgi:arginine-tRNA-protein transferase
MTRTERIKMNLKGVLYNPYEEKCPYIEGKTARNEAMQIKELSHSHLDLILSMGFRHFGDFFFRPICLKCRKCIPMRIPVRDYRPSKSVQRLYKRNEGLSVELVDPEPTWEMFYLFLKHKTRFKLESNDTFESYKRTFFYPFDFNKMLVIRDGTSLVAVSHLDITALSMSAIYCYFDEAYKSHSPGKFAVYKEIDLARKFNIKWLYLGYYVSSNKHMNYKTDFKPNQMLVTDHVWIDYMNPAGELVNELPEPDYRLLADYKNDHSS